MTPAHWTDLGRAIGLLASLRARGVQFSDAMIRDEGDGYSLGVVVGEDDELAALDVLGPVSDHDEVPGVSRNYRHSLGVLMVLL